MLAGIACAFAGLCYAEFASMIPIAGSAYTYSYATLGELVAWIIGWDLILEYAFGAATVAVGWSGILRAFLQDLGFGLPKMPTLQFHALRQTDADHLRLHRLHRDSRHYRNPGDRHQGIGKFHLGNRLPLKVAASSSSLWRWRRCS